MPIYAYRCGSCAFGNDHLQKLSDPQLVTCPECGQDNYRKQLTAPGFQLKGNGWYATDFKGGEAKPKPQPKTESASPCQGCAGADTCAAS